MIPKNSFKRMRNRSETLYAPQKFWCGRGLNTYGNVNACMIALAVYFGHSTLDLDDHDLRFLRGMCL